MSSEMRELIAKWRDTADQCEERGLEACSIGLTVAANKADARADELRGCANELEALLARTEAGADGAIYQMMATDEDVDEDGNVRPDDPRLWMDHSREEYERLKNHPSVRSRIVYSHPQDASGNAVAELIAAADVLNTGAKHGLSTYPEDWKRLDAALDAMQAKEAK